MAKWRSPLTTLRAGWRAWSRYHAFGESATTAVASRIVADIYGHLYAQAAARLGLSCESLGPILRISDGAQHFHVYGPVTDHDRLPLNRICGDKEVTRVLLEKAGFSIPAGAVFSLNEESAGWGFASGLDGSCVIKPARGTAGGKGVTVNITTRRVFRQAFRRAGLLSTRVLVERFVHGENYRILVLRGHCLSAVHRILPAITGDGHSTIDDLIERENMQRIHGPVWKPEERWLMPLPRDRAAQDMLRSQGWSLKSVPPEGTTVRLSEVASWNLGTTYREGFHEIHPEILAVSERVSEMLGPILSGVDLIIPDVSRPDYWINEVNTTPGPALSYMINNPESARHPVHRILAEYFGRPWPVGPMPRPFPGSEAQKR